MADLPIQDLLTADPLRATLVGSWTLEGVTNTFRLWMNSRSFRWSLDVFDVAGRSLIQGHAIVAQADVFVTYRAQAPDLFPPGQLFSVPAALDGQDPVGFDAWRDSHAFRYRPVADLV